MRATLTSDAPASEPLATARPGAAMIAELEVLARWSPTAAARPVPPPPRRRPGRYRRPRDTLAAVGGRPAYPNGPIVCGDVACRGAYVIEEAGQLWLVSYTDERWGFTRPFHATDVPRWEAIYDDAIEHRQQHNKGTQVVEFALRDRAVVALELHDTVRAGDVDHVFVEDGKCKPRCRALVQLAKDTTLGWYMQPVVVGPVPRLADLREPPPPPDQ